MNHVQLDTGYVGEETTDGVGSIFSPGVVTNYVWHLLIHIQHQEVEALEYYDEGDSSHLLLYQKLLSSFRINPNPSLIPNM